MQPPLDQDTYHFHYPKKFSGIMNDPSLLVLVTSDFSHYILFLPVFGIYKNVIVQYVLFHVSFIHSA